MPDCHSPPRSASRPVVVAPYLPDDEGELVAVLPEVGACNGAEGLACRLGRHATRNRKTGPEHALQVLICHRHGEYFTLYPEGFSPYGREPDVPVAPDGSELQREQMRGRRAFEGTVFDAALDAAAGRAWAEPWDACTERRRSTQQRRIERAGERLGLTGSEAGRWQVAEVLDIALLDLQQSVGLWAEGGYRNRGEAIARVLDRLGGRRFAHARLLEVAYMTGNGGCPWRWDGRRRVLERTPFRGPLARGPPG